MSYPPIVVITYACIQTKINILRWIKKVLQTVGIDLHPPTQVLMSIYSAIQSTQLHSYTIWSQ